LVKIAHLVVSRIRFAFALRVCLLRTAGSEIRLYRSDPMLV
jgi:hypothetical protein